MNSAAQQPVKLNRRARLQRDKVTGSPILLYPEGVLVLNVTGEAIIRLCDGTRNLPEITTELMQAYHAPRELIEGDVKKLLDRLAQLNLLTGMASTTAEGAEPSSL